MPKRTVYRGHPEQFNPPQKVAHARDLVVSGRGGFGPAGTRTNADDSVAKRSRNASMPDDLKSGSYGVNGCYAFDPRPSAYHTNASKRGK